MNEVVMGSVGEEGRGYNGWTNYETWAVALWIGNEPGSYEHWEQDQAGECYRAAVRGHLEVQAFDQGENPAASIDRAKASEEAVAELADRLKRELDDEAELPRAVDGTMYADLLNAAIQEVNWYEIAEHYVADLDRATIEREEADAVRIEPADGDEPG
jgi:hypothetical protein